MPPPDCPPGGPIAALIPAALPRPRPVPAPVGDLPPGPPAPSTAAPPGSPGTGPAIYAIARLNRSGQISAAGVMSALGWAAGDLITVTVRHGAILVRPTGHGRRAIGADSALVLPAAARRMCAIGAPSAVLLAALPDADLLIIHPIATLARLLARRHTQILERPS
ncbi:hypothetical protein AB0H43_22310 [Hamadaea sp. NPDC050747]|uniref:hypothetical protein n=1 Tax=Hamadaea sp. NPDC050747 TaxID=3155789 RepID=UPI0033DA18BE